MICVSDPIRPDWHDSDSLAQVKPYTINKKGVNILEISRLNSLSINKLIINLALTGNPSPFSFEAVSVLL